ncbi:MAG: HAD-IA family hydrolase, partial [Clostridia bacterium]|nr:HAD-IA family hydrolase [Clostridia bacterium]
VQEMLSALQERGIALAIFSNKPHKDVLNVVKHFFPTVDFKDVRGQMPDVPVKPDPAGALAVAEVLGVKPEEFLYLGDMAVDPICAANAGMHGVAVSMTCLTIAESTKMLTSVQ